MYTETLNKYFHYLPNNYIFFLRDLARIQEIISIQILSLVIFASLNKVNTRLKEFVSNLYLKINYSPEITRKFCF